jgi:pimeloyl-ACP methyl ester carboxylesterase
MPPLTDHGFTPPIVDEHGQPRPGSVAALEKVKIGGVDQWLLFRGEDTTRPIMLFLHGGPGSAEIALMRTYRAALEKHAVVVAWDQRGAGKSYEALNPRSDMTLTRLVDDVRDVARLAAEVFHQPKVILVGHAWGSALGVLAAQKYPDLFAAYVGLGQVADMAESERRSYAWTLARAEQADDGAAVMKLRDLGAPPYSGDWLSKLTTQRGLLAQFGGEVYADLQAMRGRFAQAINHASEYTVLDRANFYRGMLDSLRLLWPQLLAVNLPQQAPALQVPVFLALGRHDHEIDCELAEAYFNVLQAPRKELTWFEESAHMPHLEETDKFNELLVEQVLPAAA